MNTLKIVILALFGIIIISQSMDAKKYYYRKDQIDNAFNAGYDSVDESQAALGDEKSNDNGYSEVRVTDEKYFGIQAKEFEGETKYEKSNSRNKSDYNEVRLTDEDFYPDDEESPKKVRKERKVKHSEPADDYQEIRLTDEKFYKKEKKQEQSNRNKQRKEIRLTDEEYDQALKQAQDKELSPDEVDRIVEEKADEPKKDYYKYDFRTGYQLPEDFEISPPKVVYEEE